MQSGYDINKLFREAQSRWLKPVEVYFILQNYNKEQLSLKPPQNPQSGSLFLFNRRILRFFRKDGHSWRKKKDGRTVGEAHERLKVGNVDTLNCYYAHGEQNPNFQRRCYWMLDPACDHIVLVHYREVTEGKLNNLSTSNVSSDCFSNFSQSVGYFSSQHAVSPGSSDSIELYRSSFSPGSVEEVSSKFVGKCNDLDSVAAKDGLEGFSSSCSEVNQAIHRLQVQLSLDDDDNVFYFEKLPMDNSLDGPSQDTGVGQFLYESDMSNIDSQVHMPLGLKHGEHGQWLHGSAEGQDDSKKIIHNSGETEEQAQPFVLESSIDKKDSLSWKEMLELSSSSTRINTQNVPSDDLALFEVSDPPRNGVLNDKVASHFNDATSLESGSLSLPRVNVCMDPVQQQDKLRCWRQNVKGLHETNKTICQPISTTTFSSQLSAAEKFLLDTDDAIVSPSPCNLPQEIETFVHSTYSPGTSIATNSGTILLGRTDSIDWMETRSESTHKHTPDYYEVWFDQESNLKSPLEVDSNLIATEKHWFSIREISPEWAYATEGAKLIITGDFLCDPLECAWRCKLGNIEIPAEVIQPGVLRCQVPQHDAGKVTLCITAGNGEPCSEMREFEYLTKPEDPSLPCNLTGKNANKTKEELLLLVNFVEILLQKHGNSSTRREDSVGFDVGTFKKSKSDSDPWSQIIQALLVGGEPSVDILDCILQELLKDKMQQWLSPRTDVDEVSNISLSKEEQGIIHMIAGLGYDWALNSVLNAGIGINFRDGHGWTALHWAAHFGREKMVAALLAAGASASAVTDPTAQDPVGKNPASIAAACGHKGLAGYLSEVSLRSHLSSLTLESECSLEPAALEAERAAESIADKFLGKSDSSIEDHLSLKDSLAAVRSATHAAARIQAAFRAHSFRKRQLRAAGTRDEYGMTADEIHGIAAASKFLAPRDPKLNTAALSIQKKYRGWKGRKEFLSLRQNVVKIQAHVRGHQVRKKYKELLWTVGVLEKVILRWRRRGAGLRGFRSEQEPIDETEDDDILKVFRKQKVDAAVDEALSRVLSIVDSPTARLQYRRMLESYSKAKAESDGSSNEASSYRGDYDMERDPDYMYHIA